ncbi:hypothetical protein Mal48_05880 [Thalassoglobus polymorphus]|uniref:Uncharacterized protein n=2 Tax=Thalassoglobus polymorphus TaxID=2527994 RepID=A0A517QIC8_9PLAN|nr:hypothetical protein Mal48_05880 [Thalassoglobus polymorphus]
MTLDGVLPVAIAASPFLVRYTVRDGHVLEVAVAILAPVLAAILRAAIGVHQLDAVTNGKPNITRQILFSMAIVMLLLVEIFVSTLQFAQNEPLSSWFLPAGLFFFYLILIQNALRPDETTQYV